MSRSIRSFVSGKTINKQVQLNNRLTTFTTPPIQTGDLYVTRDLYVARNTHLNNLDICGNLTVTGNTYLNNLDVSANVDISGNLTVTGNTFLNNLDVSANVDISGNLTIQQNVFSYGTIKAQQYLPGQIVNVSMLNNSEIGFTTINIQRNIGANIYVIGLFTYNYTPKIATSHIIIEFQSIYTLGGSNTDYLYAYIDVSGDRISSTYQQWVNPADLNSNGNRSSVLFPIVGRYTNFDTRSKSIQVKIDLTRTDDTFTVYGDNSTWLKITEIGRNNV
jgi:hypothetical protein